MRVSDAGLRYVVAVFLFAIALPSLAAGFDCARASGVVEKTICASPKLSHLDSELSAAYVAALVRDPAQAAAIREDERNWLGERDDVTWSALHRPRNTPRATAALARMYQQRIDFLRNLDDPLDVRGSPLVGAVLAAVPRLPPGSSNVVTVLWQQGFITLPLTHRVWTSGQLLALLPAPPDGKLAKQVETPFASGPLVDGSWMLTYGVIGVAYVPGARFGGVYNIGGTAECKTWTLFMVAGSQAHAIAAPKSLPLECGGHFWNGPALMDRVPVALTQITGRNRTYWGGALSPQTVDLQWQRWGGNEWGAEADIRVRFARDLRVTVASCAPSVDCKAVRTAALDAARRFDQRPLPRTLADSATLTTVERAQFKQMLAVADSARHSYLSHQTTLKAEQAYVTGTLPQFGKPGYGSPGTPAFANAAIFFPARIGGELAIGEIGHGQRVGPVYSGPVAGSSWHVGFWSWRDAKLVPIAGVVVDRASGMPLLAARMWPLPPPDGP